jgi:DNA-binding NtrC family response regulator
MQSEELQRAREEVKQAWGQIDQRVAAGRLEEMLFGAGGDEARPKGQPLGRMELAAQGTLFLEEVGALPERAQGRLLEAIQRLGRVGPGGARPEVRFIAASNRDLSAAVAEGRFRADLFVCLGACTITVPPLRRHREDIPVLAAAYVARFNRSLGKAVTTIPDPVLERLMAMDWPGNLRELAAVLERAVITSAGPVLELR